MYNQQNFGHFGAPDQLGSAYGSEQSTPESFQEFATSDSSDDTFSEAAPFNRNGKTLPFVKGGAFDQQVQGITGITGLISEIQRRMGVPVTGTISNKQILDYQKSQGLTADGTIGTNTYTKLGFKPPFQKSSSRRGSSPAPVDQVIGSPQPFYSKEWFQYTVIGLAIVGTIAIFAWPKGD